MTRTTWFFTLNRSIRWGMYMNFGKLMRKILVLLVVSLILSGCGGAESRKAKYLERGKNYLSEQNYDKAAIEFKNVLQIDPKYAEAYFQLGRAEEGRNNYRQAFGLYSKAVELNPDHLEAHIYLGRFYLLGGDLAKSKEQVDTVLAKEPTNTKARLLKAAITAKEGKDDEAIKQASELIKDVPSEDEAYSLIAGIYFKEQKQDQGIEILQKGISANPKNISLRIDLAQLYAKKGENDKAEVLLQECVSLEPQNFQHRLILASFLTKTNQLDKAEKVLRAAIAQDPEDDKRQILLAQFLSTARKDNNAAEQELLKAIKEIPDSSNLRFALANLYEQTNKPTQTIDTYQGIIKHFGEKPDGLKARNQLAGFYLRQGNEVEAEKLVDDVLQENPNDNDALMIKSRFLLSRHDAQGAIAALRTVLRDQPNLVDAYLYLADAHTLNNEPSLAKDSLMKAVELNPTDVRARLALAQYSAKTGDVSAAMKMVDDILKHFPDNYEALGAKYELFLAKKDVRGAQETLARLKTAYPDRPVGYYQLGLIYLNERKYEAALREFEQALSKRKGDYQIMAAIVNTYVAEKKPEQAISRLNDELAKEPASRSAAYELLAEVYIRQKKYDDAEKALHKAIEANPKWNIPYRNLANIYRSRGDYANATQIFQQGLGALPDDPQLLLSMAETYERSKDYAKAIAAYDRVLTKQPVNDVAANNLAALLLDHPVDSSSLKHAKELASRFESSQQPAFRDTLGWMYYRSGELDKAIEVMGKVVKQAPNVGIFRYHLGMAYYKKGDNASAKIQLSKALDAKSDFTGIEEARTTLKQIQ